MYTGLTGTLELAVPRENKTIRIAYISGWSIDDSTEMIETSELTSIHRDALPSFQSWSASAEGSVVFEQGGSQEALYRAKHNGEKLTLQFYLKCCEIPGTTGKSVYYQGEGYIESLSVDLSAGDKGNISIGIKGVGALKLFVNGKDVKDGSSALEHLNVPPCLLTGACAMKFEVVDGNLIFTYSGTEASRLKMNDKGELICDEQ